MHPGPNPWRRATARRNVDDRERLAQLARPFAAVGEATDVPVVVSVHARNADRLGAAGLRFDDRRVVADLPIDVAQSSPRWRSAPCLADGGSVDP